MIQRIQSVYLFLVFLFALLFLSFPKANIEVSGLTYSVKTLGIINPATEEILGYKNWLGTISAIVPFLIMILSVVTTFMYKKRLLQIKLGGLNILLHLLLIVTTFFYLDAVKTELNASLSYGIALIFPFVSMVFILFANRAIRRDENLVRSADRLR
jgi:hypothetical protein